MRGKGFTLIEILVVIAIMALLIAVSISTFSTFQKGGRDAKRKSDLAVVQSVLQHYYADQGFYPSSITFGSSLTSSTGNPSPPAPERTYQNKLAVDPSSNPAYLYLASPSGCDNSANNKCTRYCLYAMMEKVSDKQDDSSCSLVSSYNPIDGGYEVASP